MKSQLHNSTTLQLHKPKIFSSLLLLCLVVFMMSFAEIIAQSNEEGNLVYSGSDFTVNSLVAKKYKLEVIAEGDGHKDYREIETEDKRRITSVSPNPASTTTQVEYLIAPNDNAYIMVTNSVTGVNHNFMLVNI